jgi:predicted lipid-binding transport protein (Tim44 family)
MSDGFAYLDIIFFAMVAAFIAFRLRNVLGRKMGNERRRADPILRPAPEPAAVPRGERQQPAEEAADEAAAQVGVTDPAVKAGLAAIRLADPSFRPDTFLQGAKAAFGMVVEAFGRGDRPGLSPLLSERLQGEFGRAIEERERNGHVLTSELVSVRTADITAASMRGTRARVSVRFASEQINVTRDAAGAVVDGDPKQVAEVLDLWTFERDTRSKDPNWEVVETAPAA